MSERAYRVTLTALPGGAPAIVRLRRALKTLLRMYRFRCKAVEELEPDVSATPGPPKEAA